MTHDGQSHLLDELRSTISCDRLGTYLSAAGFDNDRALRLYVWNANVGEAFHFPIQGVEVGLRNCVNKALKEKFGDFWWKEASFLALADRERITDIETAKRRINNKKKLLVTPQVVASLSFGFWVGMLQPRYNPSIWSSHLRVAFASLPNEKNRYDLAASAKRVADLRNRIWHHEPIFRMNLLEEFQIIMEILNWICPIKAAWIRPQCRVAQIIRQKP